MDKSYFIELLKKYLNGKATKQECEFLLGYYEVFESEPDVIALMSPSERDDLRLGMNKDIWDTIEDRESAVPQVSVIKLWFTRAAVAAAVIIVLAAGLQFFNNAEQKIPAIASRSEHVKEHRLIRLPDGSTVIISAGSKFNYPSSFDGSSKREVYLEGQAYFDIKHNDSKPFIVHTGKVSTTVLGTAFNVKAWPAADDVTVTVARGKVRVEAEHKTLGIITPNQQITYDMVKADAVQKTVNADEFLSWKDQDLLLDDVTVAEASELLEMRFKVKIAISDEQIRTKRFTTTFLRKEGLEKVLKSICEFNGASYSYDKEKSLIVLSSK
jgi:transmembrane sensor